MYDAVNLKKKESIIIFLINHIQNAIFILNLLFK